MPTHVSDTHHTTITHTVSELTGATTMTTGNHAESDLITYSPAIPLLRRLQLSHCILNDMDVTLCTSCPSCCP